ncbi:MAG: ABC transporter ATP-binding protein [Anaerolineaceae bacterium]
MALIEAVHLRKLFGDIVAVDDVSLVVESGQIYGLVGSDGAGKTTTLRLLVGALKPDSGTVTICGHPLASQGEQARSQIGYLSQRFSLYEDLTVLENIRFFAEVRGLTQQEWLPRCMELLDFVGLAAFKERRAGQLSGGMKQKLGLASALVTMPKVLLLDEPTTGVDPVTRQDFWQLLIRVINQQELAVILTTPYMDEASRCHRIGFMRRGRMLVEGSPDELQRKLNGQIVEVRGGTAVELRQLVNKLAGVEDIRAFGDRLHLRVKPGQAKAVSAHLAKSSRDSASAREIQPSLEDVFIYLSDYEKTPGSKTHA